MCLRLREGFINFEHMELKRLKTMIILSYLLKTDDMDRLGLLNGNVDEMVDLTDSFNKIFKLEDKYDAFQDDEIIENFDWDSIVET